MRSGSALALLVLVPAAALGPARAAGQLRPLEPIPWEAVGGADGARVAIGVGYHSGARATLAGTRGSLLELGDLAATWTLGRVVLELGGTALRVFADDSAYAEPVHGARASDGTRRVDTGEHRLGTIVTLASTGALDGVLRFGTRLPTTDNGQGLGRDQTDFYGTVGGRWRRGVWTLAGEAGVGILETRLERPEQVDVLLYAARAGWADGRARLWVEAVGQHDPRRAPELRGLEDLGELRAVAELGTRRWAGLTLVRGLTSASARLGAALHAGVRF